MTASASDRMHLWTGCFAKMGQQNRELMESFTRSTQEEFFEFLHRGLERHRKYAERMQHGSAEILAAQQEFSHAVLDDWAEKAHKLGDLYRRTTEDGMKQASQTVASIIPFEDGGGKRKAA